MRLRRPPAEEVLDAGTRAYLERRTAALAALSPGDPRISKEWTAFLRTEARRKVEQALDAFTHRKCAYCEQVAAADIEHFQPKTSYPAGMFRWDNFLRGCKNCNQAKRDQFPLDPAGRRLLIDPCSEEPLDYFVWDLATGATGLTLRAEDRPRALETHRLFHLDQEPLREERRAKALLVLYLLARVVEEDPVSPETRERLRDELAPHRPWLGLVRQLFVRRAGPVGTLVERALAKLPELRRWTAAWL